MSQGLQQKVLSVTEITQSIRGILETQFPFTAVMGEVSNLRRPYSGHLYFTLKDSGAQLKAVLFKPQQRYLKSMPEDGMEVICRGRISVYEQRGDYQLIVDYLEPKGIGSLQIAFEQLKQQLEEEGLFGQEKKQPLPLLPQNIVLITSPQGAAVHDFVTVAQKRFPDISLEIYPVRVQGDGAGAEIAQALKDVNLAQRHDIIVLCRGGGSLEDLWAFNEEKVARAISDSTIPVVSAVGHEVDFTIADFVADHRSPTPSAAAEEIIPDKAQLTNMISGLNNRLATTILYSIQDYRDQVKVHRKILGDPTSILDHFRLTTDHLLIQLQHALKNKVHSQRYNLNDLTNRLLRQSPKQRLERNHEHLNEQTRHMAWSMQRILERKKAALEKRASLLDAVSPLAVLGRGYSITKSADTQQVIRAADQVKVGERLHVTLHQGQLDCEVTKRSLPKRKSKD